MEYNVALLFFVANLVFIVTNLNGWILKRLYTPIAYAANYSTLYPAQHLVASLYLLQLFELPYLLNIDNPDALFYVNAFSVLCFSSMMILMVKGYFFLQKQTLRQLVLHFAPAVLVLTPLLLQAVGLVVLPKGSKMWMFIIVSGMFLIYFYHIISITKRINRAIFQLREMEYSSEEDFPVSLARRLRYLPVSICLVVYISFAVDNAWVKFVRDAIFIVVNVWFAILTIDPWRTAFTSEEQTMLKDDKEDRAISQSHMSAERYAELSTRVRQVLDDEKIFLNPHLTMERLMVDMKMDTNRSYVSETIGRLGYKSFYDMVNRHRVEYAIAYIRSYPEEQLKKIALECGFSTQYAMSKAFRTYKKSTPSSFRYSDN